MNRSDLTKLQDFFDEIYSFSSNISDVEVSSRGMSLRSPNNVRQWDVLIGRFESILLNYIDDDGRGIVGLTATKKRLRDRTLLKYYQIPETLLDCDPAFEKV